MSPLTRRLNGRGPLSLERSSRLNLRRPSLTRLPSNQQTKAGHGDKPISLTAFQAWITADLMP